MSIDEVERENARIEAEGKAERDTRVFTLLNRLPINLSAERLIDEKFANAAPENGLHIIRLLVCLANDEKTWISDRDSVVADLLSLCRMDADEAVDFMFNFGDEYGVDTDAEDFERDGDFMVDVMSVVYDCIPVHLQECMCGIGE